MSSAAPTSDVRHGLTDAEVANRQQSDGFNELPRPDRRTVPAIVVEVLREPMLSLLLAGGLVYLLLGDMKEALILLVFATLSVTITVVQESRTEKVLEALRDLTSPRALVIRNGKRVRIAGRDVVRGDIVCLSEGDRVPADAVLLEASDLEIDESLLTGESVPVRKTDDRSRVTRQRAVPGGNDLPYVFSGSLIVRGSGIAEVTATGARGEIGKIGQSLSQLELEPPRLRAQTRRLTRIAAIGGAVVSVLAVLLYGLMRGGWLEAILAGIALGMSMLPEEFPVVLAVFMAMGAWRISRAQVLTRRAAAIETLGSATVLCTDKTGTLTENRMKIAELRRLDGAVLRLDAADRAKQSLDEPIRSLLEIGTLACAPEPFDPMEKAFHEASADLLHSAVNMPRGLVQTFGLRPDLLAVSNVWKQDGAVRLVVATKGAPEAVARLCQLDDVRRSAMTRAVEAMAADGLRVLAVATANYSADELPTAHSALKLDLVGLVGLADPLRQSVPAAVADCRRAGIKVVMITGDYPVTAASIGKAAGIDVREVITGEQLSHMDDAELARRVQTATIFARIMPEQKLRIVNAFKANGEIVGMTGDGVNDAPSLKSAHIGIAMGGRGTDVAREASSIVLLNDDFGSIVGAVRLGRRIYDNLRKAMGFIFAVHVPIAGLAILPLVSGLPLLFGPVHIALLEMVIDPVCSLVFEAEEDERDVMDRSPRSPAEPLFSSQLIGWSVFQGFLTFALAGGITLIAARRGLPDTELRALAFFTLVMSVLALILVNRSFGASVLAALRRPNPTLLIVVVVVGLVLSLSLLWQPFRDLVRFGPLHADDLAVTIGAGFALMFILEKMKTAWFRPGET